MTGSMAHDAGSANGRPRGRYFEENPLEGKRFKPTGRSAPAGHSEVNGRGADQTTVQARGVVCGAV
jgi:hypothetical protein